MSLEWLKQIAEDEKREWGKVGKTKGYKETFRIGGYTHFHFCSNGFTSVYGYQYLCTITVCSALNVSYSSIKLLMGLDKLQHLYFLPSLRVRTQKWRQSRLRNSMKSETRMRAGLSPCLVSVCYQGIYFLVLSYYGWAFCAFLAAR